VLLNLLVAVGHSERGAGQQQQPQHRQENAALQVERGAAKGQHRAGSQSGQENRDEQHSAEEGHRLGADDLLDLRIDDHEADDDADGREKSNDVRADPTAGLGVIFGGRFVDWVGVH
jgi:hypothetical protein